MNNIRQVIKKEDGSRFSGEEIHLRQGEIDGACGPYCLLMAVIALGLAEKNELICGRYHGNSKIAKLIKALEQSSGEYFFRNGANREHLNNAIKIAFNRDIELVYREGSSLSGRGFRGYMDLFVKDDVDLVWPVIIEISFGKNSPWSHYVLVVGYEHNPDGESRYLLLDPGTEKPRKGDCWNAKLEARGSGSPLPYIVTPNHGDSYRVAINDALGFIPK